MLMKMKGLEQEFPTDLRLHAGFDGQVSKPPAPNFRWAHAEPKPGSTFKLVPYQGLVKIGGLSYH